MASKNEKQIPSFDLTRDSVEGSDERKILGNKLRKAAEEYGCFLVHYKRFPSTMSEEMFTALKLLFDLPQETKAKNESSHPYYGYHGKFDIVPLYESLGIEDALSLDAAQDFAKRMWPDGHGNPFFWQTVNSVSNNLAELGLMILKLIMESYGVENEYNSYVESTDYLLRVIKYDAPKNNVSELGLVPHTDKNAFTVLAQDNPGLEVLLKDGDWIPVPPQDGSFIVFIGEMLKAWSNGRLYPASHRVIMSGDQCRYSYALFIAQKEGVVVEAPKELIDEKHPQLYRPFQYMDFLRWWFSRTEDNSLENYAGV